ncbi:MAG: polysaccharide deacetylase [Lachnospiraceae bacterium]|nr:polysaccharide deacetylase [Lachnospiraceae bacterium]
MKSKEGVKAVVDRKKRVQRLKKIILAMIAVFLILPSLFCIILAVKIGNLERQIKELKTETHKSLEIVWNEKDVLASEEPGNEYSDENEVITEEDNGLKKVYLTFDDGPSIYTKDILDILKRYNVKATFFVTGMNTPLYDEYLQKILDDGHSLGIHTYSHVYSDVYESLESFQADFNKMRDYIKQQTGQDISLYRFPGGSGNNVVSAQTREQIMEWLEAEGIKYFDWNVSSGDAENRILSAETIADNCIEGVKKCNTAIVLLHDAGGKKSTIEALPLIIEGINQLDDTILLPIDEETVTIQQIRSTKE